MKHKAKILTKAQTYALWEAAGIVLPKIKAGGGRLSTLYLFKLTTQEETIKLIETAKSVRAISDDIITRDLGVEMQPVRELKYDEDFNIHFENNHKLKRA